MQYSIYFLVAHVGGGLEKVDLKITENHNEERDKDTMQECSDTNDFGWFIIFFCVIILIFYVERIRQKCKADMHQREPNNKSLF